MAMKTNVIALLYMALMLGCISCNNTNKEKNDVQKVRICKVESASASSSMQYPGHVKAKHDINLSFKVAGTIERIFPAKGEYVRKGQLVALLDSSDYRIQLDATEAEYKKIKAKAERVISLYKENVSTPDDYDQARYGLKQITAKLDNHRNQLEYTRMYAPFSGYVQDLYFDAHETVGAGMPVVSVVEENNMEVEINLPVSDVIDKADMQKAYCKFDVYPDEVFPLDIVSVNRKANSNQLYSMRLRFIEKDIKGRIYPGMVNMVIIEKKSSEDAGLSVPTGAIFHEDGRSYVMVYDNETKTVRKVQVVVTLLKKIGMSIVRSTDLKSGLSVVYSGARNIKDGEKVDILPEAGKSNIGGLL